MVSETGLRVVRSNSCKGPSLSWKRAKKEPKGQTNILGPVSVIWDQIYDIWPQKGQPGNPALSSSWLLNMKRLVILKQQRKKTSITGEK